MASKEIKLSMDVGKGDDEDEEEPPAAVLVFVLILGYIRRI